MINSEDIKDLLLKAQQQTFQHKMMNIIYTLGEELAAQGNAIVKLQDKMNQIINELNQQEEIEDAEALNHDIQEDVIEADVIDEYTGAALSQEDKE